MTSQQQPTVNNVKPSNETDTPQKLTEEKAPKKPRLSLSQMILIALLGGIICGLFFGEWCANLQIIGDVFIGLLQMTVLPAIVFSLISGIGRLTVDQSTKLASKAILVLLMLWGIGFTTVLLIPLAFPTWQSASFFSTSFIEEPKSVDLFGLFIPKNPFNSLADNEVPAVVLFCIFMGISLITIPRKKRLLKLIDILSDSMSKVTKMVVKLTPIGVFAIAASAAGTMTFQDLGRLQGYFITYILATVILGGLILPAIIASLTPFSYKDILSTIQNTLILTFAAGKVLVALPLIVDNIKTLFKKYEISNEDIEATAEVIVPLSFPFPHLGRLVVMSFIPFSAWFVGTPLGLLQYGILLPVGFLVLFGSSSVAIPFMLDLMRLPADMFQVFVLTDVLIDRLSNVLAAVHLFTVGIVTTAALFGFLQIRWKRLRNLLISGLILAVIALFSTKIYLSNSLAEYDKDKIIANMQLLQPSVSSVIVEPAKNPIPLKPNQSLLNRVQERGIIRIGYIPDNLPFSYTNAQGNLVGFDIDMAQRLAQELKVQVEFVPFKLDNLNRVLNEDYFDLGMSGILGTVERSSEETRFSDPYLNVTMALVVPDYRDREFADLASINRMESLKIGVTDKRLFGDKIKLYLPNAEVVFLESPRDFFEKKNQGKDADALLSSAEAGSAWTLLYPRFQVVNPLPRKVAIPLVYPFNGRNDATMDEFIDHWVELKKLDGTIDEVYDYWILGKGSEKKGPRWSIIRNVLGWI